MTGLRVAKTGRKPVENFVAQSGEFRASVIDDRIVHGPQNPVGNICGAWDLKKVTTGMNHENSAGLQHATLTASLWFTDSPGVRERAAAETQVIANDEALRTKRSDRVKGTGRPEFTSGDGWGEFGLNENWRKWRPG